MPLTKSPSLAEPPRLPDFPHGEDLLQFIWEQQLFARHDLATVEGNSVEVVKPGRLQPNSGPDFHDGRIRLDDQLFAGNIEVHVRASEWFLHRHHEDPAYDNVILHVVHTHDMDVRTSKGGRVPTLVLGDRISKWSLAAYERLMHTKAWVPCAGSIGAVDPARIDFWLERLLIERLERKTKDVEQVIARCRGDEAEAFHQHLAAGFGFKVNAEPFAQLARALPLKVLLKYRDNALRTEALVLGTAGLLQVDFVDEHPRRIQEEFTALAVLHGLRPLSPAIWKFGRLRPANFPTVRLVQFARLFSKLDGVFGRLLEQERAADLIPLLEVEADGYWHDHWLLDKTAKPEPKRLGSTAAELLVINVIVPFLFAVGRLHGKPELADRALGLLDQLPPEANTIIEGWESLGIRARSAARTQPLLELKNEYCGQRRCLHCVIGTELLKRPAP
ncbi:MAG: DUF2851 family protein [Flavobacteriales bacterium]|nr:MAG: DUF2851 family protein [Flavobacteriales bacterium]